MFHLDAIKMSLRNLLFVDIFSEAAVVLLIFVDVDFDGPMK